MEYGTLSEDYQKGSALKGAPLGEARLEWDRG